MHPKKLKSASQRDDYTAMSTAAPFTIAKIWKPLKYLLMDEWKKKYVVYIYIYFIGVHTQWHIIWS